MMDLERILKPIISRIRSVVVRGTVSSSVETGPIRRLDVSMLQGEERDDLEHLEPYGLTGAVTAGAEVVVLNLGGVRNNGLVVVSSDRRSRPTDLSAGEVAVYSAHGNSIKFRENGDIEVSSSNDVLVTGAQNVNISAANVSVAAENVNITGTTVDIDGNVRINGITQVND